ncbi:MAG: tRNA glutamyl-Q(34) synthetase GluQRS [Solirubrobacteraceae bacterium]|nr:tRNA glutamyl-Q(34) synthetase GluQRS [Solirubrobacteraceae bacterium]
MDGRFAPSPSADLHLGNLRTALLSWLAARAQGSAWRLRIDDLDTGRSRPDIAARQLQDLALLGLTHDGDVPTQSARTARYAEAFGQLQRSGMVYPCFCTRAEIREASSAPHGAPTAGYPGTCRDLTPAQRAERAAEGRPPAWRFRSDPEPVRIEDMVLGPQTLPAEDAVLRRADGEFGYQLAVVLDDADQGVQEVVRGADLLSSVATQRQLQDHLALPRTAYAHVPLMVGPDGVRLAKRHGAATLHDVLQGRCELALPGLTCGQPASPEQLRGALAASAGLVPAGSTPSLLELTQQFSYARLPGQSTMMQRCS